MSTTVTWWQVAHPTDARLVWAQGATLEGARHGWWHKTRDAADHPAPVSPVRAGEEPA